MSTKLLGMLTHLDWSSLTAAGLYLMHTGPVSTANCPSPSPVANCFLWVPSSHSWLAFPCLLPVASRSRAQAFVWFRAKTDKGIVCLADHQHSVTNNIYGSVGWGCRIHRLLLCNGIRLLLWVFCIWHQTIWWWCSSNSGALRNEEYPFIAIAPRSTLSRSGSTW